MFVITQRHYYFLLQSADICDDGIKVTVRKTVA